MTSLPHRSVAGGWPRHWLRQACACPGLAGGMVLALIFIGAGGCLHREAKPAAGNPPAVVVVENHTDYGWHIAFSAVKPGGGGGDGSVGWQGLAPREVRRVELAGGVYRVRRALADEADDGGVELNFESGKTYAWPLGTLLSTEEGEP